VGDRVVSDNPKLVTPKLVRALFRDMPEHEIRDVVAMVSEAHRRAKSNRELCENLFGILAEASRVLVYIPDPQTEP
jgi:hypothetical protein